MSTQIECKLIREGGTFAEVGGTEYHFAPQSDGAHVATIDNDDHADVFLSITEGYRLYRGAAKAAPVAIEKAAEPVAPAAPQAVIEPQAPATEVYERAALAAEYERLTGEKPHAKTGVKKLRELIAAKQTV
jgi:hypothetical protein